MYWQGHEIYFLVVILLIPTTIMIFAYARIIIEICRVFEERSKMARESMESSSRKISARTTTQASPQKKYSVGFERKHLEYNGNSDQM